MQDIHSEYDKRNISIDYIGVDEVKIPIIFKSLEEYHSIASINAGVSLDEKTKGAHLSRIVEVFNEVLSNKVLTLSQLNSILVELASRVESEDIMVDIKMPIMIPSKSPISCQLSYIDTLVELEAFKNKEMISKKLGLSLYGAMCCPSSKSISKYGAHSQRCLLKVTLGGLIDSIKIEDVAKIMENAFSAPVRSVIKRTDEKYLTERAYENPKFSEDLIRDTLIVLSQVYHNLDIEAESTNFESIHSHNVRARGRIKR